MAAKEVKVLLPFSDPKKKVVKFETDRDDQAIKNVYVSKESLKALGDPDGIEVIIRPIKES